ncbi:hypothetical protein GCM10010199_08940 [Dactylosporangium roseum]
MTPDSPRAVSERRNASQPAGAVLVGGDVQAEDFTLAVGVDPDRDQGVDVDRPAVLADLDHEGVHPHERVVRRVQGPGAERLDLRVQMGGHLRDLAARQRGDAELLDEFLHPPGRDPSRYAVATTDTRACSARRRWVSSQSGK